MDRTTIESIFDMYDQNGKGYLDKSELSQLYEQSPIPGCEIDQLFTIIDTNSDGKIEKEEFVNSFVEVIGKFQRGDDDDKPRDDDESMMVDDTNPTPLFSGGGVTTSTPKRQLQKDSPRDDSSARFASKASWEDFTSSVGDTVYALFSYERIQAFYKKIGNVSGQPNDVLLDGFESMMRSMVKEFDGMQSEISQLKDSLEKEQEKTDNQISVLAEEMDAQIAAKEKSAREEERRASEDRIRAERSQYERRIEELTEAVSKLKKIDEKLSTSSPLQTENDRLRERVRHIMEENSALSFNLNERDTRILVLESQISTLNVELQEKHIEVQRENETAEYALRERDNMSRQLTSICSDNRKLRDFNDEVRQSITNSNSARLHHQRAVMTSYNTAASPLTNVGDGGKGIVVVENDDYFVCDPQFTHSRQNSGPAVGLSGAASYDDEEDDDVTVGTDISSLMETTASRASAASVAKARRRPNQGPSGRRRRQNYDHDSGVGTLRNDDVDEDDADDDEEDEEDDEDMRSERTGQSRTSSRRKTPAGYAPSPVPPKLRFPRSPQRSRRVQSASPAPHRASPHPPPSQTSSTSERRFLNTPPESGRSSSLRRRHLHRRSSNASLNNFYPPPPLPPSSASRPGDFTSDDDDEEEMASDVTLPSRCGSRNETMSTPSTYDNGSMSGRKKVIPGYIDEYDIQPHITAKTRLFKIILCGDANTGKSSFSLRFCKDEFLPKTRSTLGVDFRLRTIHVEHNRPVTLQIWDTAGQERFRSLSINYFRRADGVVLMYDVSNTQSFLNVREWMESIVDSVPPGTPVLLCANKTDLRTRLQQEQKEFVTSSEGAQLASSYGVFFIETSAATGGNVHHAMLSLARHLKDKTDEERNDIKRLTVVAKPQQSCCNRN